ncbi:MAG: hypothetical protein QMD53_07025 [Actinomycetota bacterium]|nr:hypothetical protein [Actinomycetota bacterium]
MQESFFWNLYAIEVTSKTTATSPTVPTLPTLPTTPVIPTTGVGIAPVRLAGSNRYATAAAHAHTVR